MTKLPVGWAQVRLDEIAEVRLGRQRSPKNHTGENMRPYLRAANVDWSGLKLDDVKSMNFTDAEAAIYRLQPGDIVLGEASGSASEVGKPGLWNGEIEDCCIQNTLLRVRSYGPDSRYLLHFLRYEAMRGAFVEHSRGVGIHHIGAARLAAWPVMLPPLAEQRRIVAALEGHLLGLACAEQALTQAMARQTQFVRSVHTFAVQGSGFGDALSGELFAEQLRRRRREVWLQANPSGDYRDPVLPDLSLSPPCPPGWSILSLEAVTDPVRVIRYGILKPRVRSLGVVPYVEVKDLAGGSLSGKSLHLTSRELDEAFSGARIKPGDIVMAVRGSYERSAIVPTEIPSANISRDVARIAPLGGVDAAYLHNYLQSAFSQSYFKRHARGVAVKGVNISTLRQLPVVVPPPERQAALVEDAAGQLLAIERLAVLLRVARKRSRALRDSLMAQAFAGRLVPQDPDDEPATELLARIQVERAAAAPKQKARAARTRKELAAPPTRVTGDNYQQEALPL
ncbi:restriction endonuclease subunit S [Micromonospora chalcea]|uniref:restriction endonuclease subunit S n=1 Tax=Micromonospora chalcea TaxID=1874 RepID=UPI0033343ABC